MSFIEWPDGMTRQPWTHQHEAYDRLGRLWADGQRGVGLISDMGTGKSLVAIALFRAYGFRRVLIVSGTKAMVEEWPEMILRETGGALLGVPLIGSIEMRARYLADLALQADRHTRPMVFVTNVESFWQGRLGGVIERVPWDCIVFDESQKIKGAGSKASLFAFRLAKLHPHAYRLIMTGTPLHDKPIDVYGQFRFVDPSIFGTRFDAFKARYAIETPITANVKKITGYMNLDELAEKMHAVCFRVDDSVLTLPPKLPPIDYHFTLTGRTAAAYRDLYDESLLVLDERPDEALIAGNPMVRIGRLHQITSGYTATRNAAGIDTEFELGDDRARAFADLLVELDPALPIVVFCQFTYDLRNVERVARAANRPYLEQSGNASQWREWRDRGDNAVLGVQYKAGGSGVDLTRSPYAVFYSQTFSNGDRQQAEKRIHRPGQTRPTICYNLLARTPGARSVDALIMRALGQKQDVGSYVVEFFRAEKVPQTDDAAG